MNTPSAAESARLAALARYSILDTEPEQSFDDLTRIAASLCGVPIALVTFLAADRQWFKAEKGLDVKETPRELSFCEHTIHSRQTLVVEDTLQHPLFQDHVLVTGAPNIRFYAGAPMIEPGGHVLGTVCVIDRRPRTLAPETVQALEALARQAMDLLEQRNLARRNAELADGAHRALMEATRSRELLQLALDAAELAAWYYDPIRNCVGGDERMVKMFGLSQPEAPTDLWLKAVVDEDRPRVAREFAASLDGVPFDSKYRIQVRGALRWVHARARVIPSQDGSVRMTGICEDVSREEFLAADLAKTAARLAIAQNVAGSVTFDWDATTDTVTWGSEKVLGRDAAELSSVKKCLAYVVEQDRRGLQHAIETALREGREYVHEFRMVWPDGEIHWVAAIGKPLPDESGKMVSILGVNMDITDRKLSEEALLRTEKLAAVGRLASVISHEINNPLEAVTNLLYIVRNNPALSQDSRQHLDLADRELARVAQITAQTLRFHKNTGGAGLVDANALVQELLALYHSRFSVAAIDVRLDLGEQVTFSAFEGDIRQVLNNLVGNAFDAMRKEGGILRIRTRRSRCARTGTPGTSITVADNGAGIPAEMRARVFEAFHSTKGMNGTGLGLWIARRITHQHNGRLSFRSVTGQGHGTVFRLWVPNDDAPQKAGGWA